MSASRCPACGRRIAERCSEHGAPAAGGNGPVSPPIHAIVPPRVPGHRVRRVIARGGFGIVFEGEREHDGATVAIKIAREDRPDARRCLAHEIAALTRIGAPHVPAVQAHGETDSGAPYVVMDHLAAPTLAARLVDRAAPLPIVEAVALTLALLDGLERVHACGYVNRDVKPENVFADDDGRVTLVDFGLAARIDAGDASLDATLEGEGIGTAEYMAPEQCEGAIDVDGRADLYAVGVILFEMLAGRPPFWGPRAIVKESHLSRRPPRISALADGRAIPSAIEDVVARCLAKDRGERFEVAADVRAALEVALREGPYPPDQVEPIAPPPAPTAPRGERMTAGLVFFQTSLDVATIRARVDALGGQIGQTIGARCVAVFAEGHADNPARRAHRAAEELIRLGIAERARVDLAPVALRARRDGARMFWSPLFSRADRYPSSSDPEGIEITPAAAAMLPEAVGAPPAGAPREALGVDAWPLIGRDALLASLVESARRVAAEGAPTIVSVVGDAGHGKSRLAGALLDRLAALEPAVRVLALRAREPALGNADHALADLLVRALDLPDAPPTDGGAALLHERLGPHGGDALAPAVALALGWLEKDAGHSPLRTSLQAQGAAPGALRAALTVAAGDALRRLAAERPLFVVIDDAHSAGDVVLAALEYAALAEARAPLWICALGRPRLDQERPAWGLEAARREQLTLGPLDPASAAELCRRLLLPVESAPESAVQRLVARAQGSPLLLVELVRGLHRDGVVRKSPKGEAFYLATDEIDRLPASPLVEWLARRELDALAPTLRGHARLLALLGEQLSIDEIAGVLRRLEWQGADADLPLDAKIATRRLLAAGLVVTDGAGRVEFRHALVREAVAHAVPAEQRRRIHAAAARYYATSGADGRLASHPPGLDDERRLAQLAYHAGEAGLADDAARSYFVLAERAHARHAFTDAERLYSSALSQPANPEALDRSAAHRGRGSMRYRIARYHDALADLDRARDLAAQRGDVLAEAEILLDEATALDWMGEHERSAERVAVAAALAPRLGSPLIDARVLLGQGRSLHRSNRNEEAARLLEAAAAATEPLGEEAYETRVIALMQLGFILPGLGRLDDARRALGEVIALCEAHGDRVHLAGALNNLGLLWGYLGDPQRMIAALDRTVALARELGQATLELMGQFNAAEYLLLMDDAAAAEHRIQRSIALDRRLSGDPGQPMVVLLEARLHLHTGDAGAARAIAAAMRARAQGSAEALMAPAEDVLCSMIELATRDATEAEWDDLEARSERFSVGQERIEVIEARAVASARAGRTDDARRALDRALALASRIPNVMGARLRRRAAEIAGPTAEKR